MKTLSIVIPVFNEKDTIRSVLSAIEASVIGDMRKEIIIVDDCSTDGTKEVLHALQKEKKYIVLYHDKNSGKGRALRSGFAKATGDYIIIQDADLEYDPNDYPRMIAPLLSGRADVVYGSRFIGGSPRRILFFWHSIGNKVLTFLSNMFTNLNLSDMETCYKAFSKEALGAIHADLTSNRFGIEPEITARIAKKKFRITEVGISYYGRTYAEGKKIGWKDGISAIWCIIKFNL